MEFSTHHVLHETFQRNGVYYDCTIAPGEVNAECSRFHVLMTTSAQRAFSSFDIMPSGDGHWLPDDTKAIDPWMADIIGKIILDNY